jgi:ribonucleoside-diphosphate reductase alpha chain
MQMEGDLLAAEPANNDFPPKAASAAKALKVEVVAPKHTSSDAPACTTCGHSTVRSGTCYKCLNCGSTTGCV